MRHMSAGKAIHEGVKQHQSEGGLCCASACCQQVEDGYTGVTGQSGLALQEESLSGLLSCSFWVLIIAHAGHPCHTCCLHAVLQPFHLVVLHHVLSDVL